MAKTQNWIIGFIILGSILTFILAMSFLISSINKNETYDLTTSGERVGIIEIEGTIYSAESTVRQLEKYSKDNSIKAIVIRIDSPGGGMAASQEIYEKVRHVRNSRKPVIASMGTVAASGGYYVACGADTIMANPGTTTGSIGVIAEIPNAESLLDKIGLRFEIIKSGKFKDTGSPYRKMTDDDRKYLQEWIDDAYQQFVDMVVTERRLSRAKVLQYADGRVFTGIQALKYGLIDTLGTYEDAIMLAGKIGGIQGKPKIVKERKKKMSFFDLVFEEDYSKMFDYLQRWPRIKYQVMF
jgi:protease IV